MRWRPFRITNPWLKLLTVVAWLGIGVALGSVFPAPSVGAALALTIVSLAVNYGLTRIFRVREEPLMPPRSWWRATGRPPAGFLIGAVSAAGVVVVLVPGYGMPTVEGTIVSAVGNAAAAVFYLNSSIRLARTPRDRALLPTRRSDF